MILTQVISTWTHIPISHLQQNKFQAAKLLDALQRRVIGQEAALNMISSLAQQSCIKLQEKPGPLCSFLFAGPHDTGKTETAHALAEHLFGHRGALLQVNLSKLSINSLADIKVITETQHTMNLLEAIRQTPYAIVVIENIHHTPLATLELFKDVLTQGHAFDLHGNKFDFHHAIIIMTTTLGTERIMQMTRHLPQESPKTVDLMQLVLNENLQEPLHHLPNTSSSHEIYEEIMPLLEAHLSASLLHYLHVIPFTPLDYSALEKLTRMKIKFLAKRLESQFGIELVAAPEVIKFLAHEALWRKPATKPLEVVFEQQLYSCIAHEILSYSENKNRSKRLLLRLNDNGHLLRCDFVNANESAMYSV